MKHDIVTSYRKNRLIHEHVHDPYKINSKLPEPTVCSICHAVFKEGRWQWADSSPINAHRQICQACHRTRDSYPAGVVTISGNFALNHASELFNLIRHHEQEENREHPEHRIMRIEQKSGGIVIETTDVHLPHAIGEALCMTPSKAISSFDTPRKAISSRSSGTVNPEQQTTNLYAGEI